MERLVILVVIYKLLPEASATLRSLATCRAWLLEHGHHIIVRDNSPEPLLAEQQIALCKLLEGCNVSYQHDGENLSLSKVYNKVIATAVTERDFLLLLDHDTTFDSQLLTTFAEAQQAHADIDLFLPLICTDTAIVSPSHQHLFKGSYWQSPRVGRISTAHVTAINSGMFIAGRYVCRDFQGYDERLAFYGTDNYFMWRYGQQRKELYVLDYTVNHVLNFYAEDEPMANKVNRLRAMRHAGLIIERQRHPWLFPLVYLYWDVFALKCAIKQRSCQFLFVR